MPIAMAIAKKSALTMECMEVPPWLKHLLSTTFFSLCEVHANAPRNECKMYCLDCSDQSSCTYCITSSHKGHRVIQIRRSSYQDVVRVAEIQKAMDITGVQTYVINSARIIFLNTRTPTNSQQNPKSSGKVSVKNHYKCVACARNLVDHCHFCSLECKMEWTKKIEGESSATEGMPRMLLSQEEEEEAHQRILGGLYKRRPSPSTESPPKASTNSRKRKGIPRRAPFF